MFEPTAESAEYRRTIDFLYHQLPMFSKVGAMAIKKGLGNILALCEMLGNPQQHFKCIHIAGTNGKGSVAHMLSATGTAAGIKTGLYTSPHYVTFRERIRVNGRYISEEAVVHYVETLMPEIERLKPSFFEITVALAFMHFQCEGVEWAIIETGLGGRLDSTNIVSPEISVITNISLEHTEMLGDSIAAIAGEKAGIIKPSVPVVIGKWCDESQPVFQQVAASNDAPLRYAADNWDVCSGEINAGRQAKRAIQKQTNESLNLELQALGKYQTENLQTVLTVFELWKQKDSRVDLAALRTGLYDLVALSSFQGRWQVMQDVPVVVIDSAHNAGGIAHLQENLAQHHFGKLHVVLGMVSDKQHDAFLGQLPRHAMYYFTAPDVPRQLSVQELAKIATENGLVGSAHLNLSSAYAAARNAAKSDDLILVTGSCFLVADFLVMNRTAGTLA